MNINREILKHEAVTPILRLLKKHDLNGYHLLKALQTANIDSFDSNEGNLYVVLHALVNEKYLESYRTEATEELPSRRYYRITPSGIKELERRNKKEASRLVSKEKIKNLSTVKI